MRISGATDIGMVRKQNQDFFLTRTYKGGQYLAVVCDGMGGSRSGDVASKLAADVFCGSIDQTVLPKMERADILSMLTSAVKEANRAVFEQSNSCSEFQGMGTTLVAVFVQNSDAYVANIGDSRCYYFSEDSAEQITEDHSIVAQMVSRGEISEQQARRHPNRNLITRAVGTEQEVECDCYYIRLKPGDSLLLCTDGLSGLFTKEELQDAVAAKGIDICQTLVDLAKGRGAPDNVTAVLLTYEASTDAETDLF